MADQNDDKSQQSRVEWMKEYYNKQYENWMPWMEDQYLKWFSKDNKTSYTAKRTSASFPL